MNKELGERMVENDLRWLRKQCEWRFEVGQELSLVEKLRKDQCVQGERLRVAEKVSS